MVLFEEENRKAKLLILKKCIFGKEVGQLQGQ